MPYSKKQASLAINFFENHLKHTGEWYGEPFIPTPWQKEALKVLFGMLDENGERSVKLAYLEIVKKSGKTEFVAALVLLFLVLAILAGDRGCEVYGAASVQRQALNVFRAACAMVEQSKELSGMLRILRSTHRIISRSDPNSFYAAIAADGDFSDGVNPKFVVADEVHRWKTRKQMENWDVLRLGGIARKHKTLTIGITTAGVINESPLAWRLHEKTRNIANGIVQDPSFYGRIYAADPGDDWEDEKTWIKANPSLRENGGFLELSKIREEYQASLTDSASQAAFRRYYLNLWDQKDNRSIDMQHWDGCEMDWRAVGLLPKEPDCAVRRLPHELMTRFVGRRCYPGVDLSLTTDLSAITLVFPCSDGGFDLLPFFFMPEQNVRKRELRDGMPYRRWAELGFLELHEGNVIDYGEIRARLKWSVEMFDVPVICFDRYNSREMSTSLVTDGIKCMEIHQNYSGLSEATKKLLKCVESRTIRHGHHPVLRWNASCLCTKSDGNDCIRPVKPDREKESSRIDGIQAAVTGMAQAILAPQVSAWQADKILI